MRHSIRVQLMAIIGVIVLSLLALTLVSSTQASNNARAEARAKATEAASVYREHLSAQLNVLSKAMEQLTTAIISMKQTGHADRALADAYQKQMLEKDPSLLATWTIFEPNAFDGKDAKYANTDQSDNTGRYIPWWHRENGEIKMSPSSSYAKPSPDSDWYTQPKNERRTIVEEPYTDPDLHVLLTTVAQPIMYKGELLGVAGIDALLSDTETYVQNAKPFGTGYAALVSASGIVVSLPGKQAGDPVDDAMKKELAKAVDAGKMININGKDPVTKKSSMRFIMPMKLSEKETWTLTVSIPESTVMTSAMRTRNQTILVGLIALLFLASVVFAIGRHINTSLEKQMGDVRRALGRLTDVSDHLTSTTAQSSSQAQLATQDAKQVSADITSVASAVEQVTASVAEISTSTAEAATQADHAVETARQAATKIEALHNASGEISGVVDLIHAISEETNLLALNATIEAARAGEAGKGFAVVANEVKELASQTASATDRIVESVNAIKAGSADTQYAIQNICEQITRIAEMQTSIGTAVTQQTAATNEIAYNVSRVAEGSTSIASRIEDVGNSIFATQTEADSVLASTNELDSVATGLGVLAGVSSTSA